MKYERIGRKVYFKKDREKVTKTSFASMLFNFYYELRIKLIERRIEKYAPFGRGFGYELFTAAVYHKQSYLHKIEARKAIDERRMWRRKNKHGNT